MKRSVMRIIQAAGAAAALALLATGCSSTRAGARGGPPLPPGMTEGDLARARELGKAFAAAPTAEEPSRRYRGIALLPEEQGGGAGGLPIQLANVPHLSPTPGTNFVVSLWLRCDRAPAAGQYVAVMGKYSESQPAASRWLLGLNSSLQPFMKTAVTSTPLTASCSVRLGYWHFLVAEWASNGAARLFVDTNQCASGSLPQGAPSDLPVTVGDTYPIGSGHALDGSVDDVRISRRRPTLTTVKAAYNAAPDADHDGVMDGNDPDDNNDGISDAWAAAHFGDRLAGAPGEDPDDDGMDNRAESIAGTDPNDDLSQFFVWDIAYRRGADAQLEVDGVADRTYTVWCRTNGLQKAGAWFQAASKACTSTGVLRISVPVTDTGSSYYRVSVRMSP